MKMRIKTARGQSGTSEELEAVKGRLGNYDANRKDLELKIRELKYELNYQMKEFETAEKHLDEDYQKLAESNEVKIEALSAKLAELTEFLDNQKDSFFNWLSEHKPGWEQTIGQVCDERLLYGKEFTAEVGEGDTFYGIRFTSGIHRNVKTKEDYLTEKKEAEEATESNAELFGIMQEALDGKVERVVVSTRLTDAPAVVTSEGGMSLAMVQVLKSQPGTDELPEMHLVLEVNAKHPVFATLQAAHEADDDEKVRTYAGLLFDQALLVEGILPDNPLAFAQAVAELMK